MIERTLYDHGGGFFGPKPISNISSNYFPIDSAIAMRDKNGSNLQVTIMNDRAQGGSADLTNKAQIEIMQHRRGAFDDGKGVQEFLNETDSSGRGLSVTARYFVHIFNFKQSPSKQREQQILIDQPIIYKFGFDFTSHNNSTEIEEAA